MGIAREDRAPVTVLLCAIALAAMFLLSRGSKGDGLSPSTKQLADSLAFTKPAHDSTVAALARVDTVFLQSDARLEREAAAVRIQSDREKARADSLEEFAELAAGDVDAWRDAHNARLAETIQLRGEITILELRIDTLKAARASARRAAALHLERKLALERNNVQLREDLQRATDCRILPGIRCPSRTHAAIGGAVAGAVAIGVLAAGRD